MIVAIVQARFGSTRLPGKIFADIKGKPLIWHVFNRLKASKKLDKILLATTVHEGDDQTEAWANSNGIDCYRGSESDVLLRYAEAARFSNATIVVRITADDPFKEPSLIDQMLDRFVRGGLDFYYNNKPPTFPEGLDVEIFTASALFEAERFAQDPFEREHVTQFFFRNLQRFSQENFSRKEDRSDLRWTIDTIEDLEMARAVYQVLYKENSIFTMDEIIQLIQHQPEIKLMNGNVARSAMYKSCGLAEKDNYAKNI